MKGNDLWERVNKLICYQLVVTLILGFCGGVIWGSIFLGGVGIWIVIPLIVAVIAFTLWILTDKMYRDPLKHELKNMD